MATKQCWCCWKVDKNRNKSKSINPNLSRIRRRVVIIGDRGTGKTCLLFRFQDKEISSTDYIPTVFEVYSTEFNYNGRKVELILSDTAGVEEYAGLRQLSYREADVIVICFALDDPGSLYSVLHKWLPEVWDYCGNIPIVLVGTKKERRDHIQKHQHNGNQVAIQYESGLEVSRQSGVSRYVECSSRTGLGVMEVFHAVVDATLTDNHDTRKTG